MCDICVVSGVLCLNVGTEANPYYVPLRAIRYFDFMWKWEGIKLEDSQLPRERR